jgi:hypothetical protein
MQLYYFNATSTSVRALEVPLAVETMEFQIPVATSFMRLHSIAAYLTPETAQQAYDKMAELRASQVTPLEDRVGELQAQFDQISKELDEEFAAAELAEEMLGETIYKSAWKALDELTTF